MRAQHDGAQYYGARSAHARARLAFALVLVALAQTSGRNARAQDGAEFRGKTITIVASFEAGGPYDFYSRLIARHLGGHLPGSPAVVVQNMPGAGGLRGANYLYNVAARDGTALGVVSQTVAVGQVLGTTPGIQYDARRYSWIGRINSNVEVQHTWHASGGRSIDDAKRREVVGIVKPWSSIKVGSADWLRDGKINLIVQYTRERHRELPQVPSIVDLGQDATQRQIFALYAGGAALGTALLAPPGVPERTLTLLRQAFIAAMRDSALIDEVGKSGVDIDPLPGADLQGVVDATFVIAPDVLDRARKLSPPQ